MNDIDVKIDNIPEDPTPDDPDEVDPPVDQITQDYGKVLHFTRLIKDTKADRELIADADVVIEDQTQAMITKNREGAVGIVATPDILSAAEVIE